MDHQRLNRAQKLQVLSYILQLFYNYWLCEQFSLSQYFCYNFTVFYLNWFFAIISSYNHSIFKFTVITSAGVTYRPNSDEVLWSSCIDGLSKRLNSRFMQHIVLYYKHNIIFNNNFTYQYFHFTYYNHIRYKNIRWNNKKANKYKSVSSISVN